MHPKLFNPLPTRLWIKKTGPFEFNFIKIARSGTIQLNNKIIMVIENIMSDALFERKKDALLSIYLRNGVSSTSAKGLISIWLRVIISFSLAFYTL
jgi:hypothetical protein